MAAIASALSTFEFDGTIVPAIGTVAITNQRPPLDVTPIGAYNSYFIEGVYAAAGTLDVYYNATDHFSLVNAGLVVQNAPLPFQFVLKTGETITGNCFITGWDIVASTTDVVRGQISFQIVGQVTFANGEISVPSSLGSLESIEE
jgi:hypothetical protein